MPSRRSVVRMPVWRALEHGPRFVGGQANAHSTTGLFHARRGRSVKATSASPCACAWSTTMLIASGVGSGQLWKSTIALSAPLRAALLHVVDRVVRDPLRLRRAARPSSRRRPRRSRCATSRARRRSGARTHRCSPPGREGGTTGGRARSRPDAAPLPRRDLVVDLFAGQIGEATVRVPVQTDEHPLGSERSELVCGRARPPPNRLA